jgi:hypothetical protein
MTESNIENIGELIVVEHKTLPILFSEGKADILVDEIEKKVRYFVPDIETQKGRKDIASLAHKIARSKTLLDNAGKQLTADWKAKAKLVDQERSRVWERLEALQDEIRMPLTEYEEKEKQRKDEHQWALGKFKTILMVELVENPITIFSLERAIEQTSIFFNSREWEEFSEQACELHEKTILILKEKLANKKTEIETQKREEAERQLKEEQEKREREEQLIKEAVERAARRVEEEARQAAKEESAKAKAQQEKELREKQRIEREKQEAEERAIQAKKDRLEVIERGKAEKIAIKEKCISEKCEFILEPPEITPINPGITFGKSDYNPKRKVYILLHEYEASIEGVFLKKESAIKHKKDNDAHDEYFIEEYEVIE